MVSVGYCNLKRPEGIIFLLCPKIPTLSKANDIFLLCPDSYFAHGQFRNPTVQSRNSYFVRQSENFYFAQVQFRNCTDSYSAQNIYIYIYISQILGEPLQDHWPSGLLMFCRLVPDMLKATFGTCQVIQCLPCYFLFQYNSILC